jgi:hypothetical protein
MRLLRSKLLPTLARLLVALLLGNPILVFAEDVVDDTVSSTGDTATENIDVFPEALVDEPTTPPVSPESGDGTLPIEETPTETLEEVLVMSNGETTDLQGASSTPQLQETFSDQQPVEVGEGSDPEDLVLASTTDPGIDVIPPSEDLILASTTDPGIDVIPPLEVADPADPSASSTPDESIIPTPPEEIPPPEESPAPPVEPPPQPPIEQNQNNTIVLSREELKPNPRYAFSINREKKIAATRKAKKIEQRQGT